MLLILCLHEEAAMKLQQGLGVDVINKGCLLLCSAFLPLQSRPGLYLFSYKIRITNESEHVVQLRNRHWVITDAQGYVAEIK